MQKARRGEDIIRLAICAGKSLLALKIARVYCNDGRILFAWVVDGLRIPERRIRVEEVVRARRKGNPLMIGGDGGHIDAKGTPSILHRGRHSRLPLVKGLPGRLDGADNSLLEMSRILLHDDDGLLECILLIDLLVKLTNDGKIGNISVEGEYESRAERDDPDVRTDQFWR